MTAFQARLYQGLFFSFSCASLRSCLRFSTSPCALANSSLDLESTSLPLASVLVFSSLPFCSFFFASSLAATFASAPWMSLAASAATLALTTVSRPLTFMTMPLASITSTALCLASALAASCCSCIRSPAA